MFSFIDNILKINTNTNFDGLTNELNIILIARYFEKNNDNILVLVNNLFDANKVFEKLKTYTNDVYLFPMDDFITSVAISASPELKITRLETLRSINNINKKIIVTNLMGYLHYLPSLNVAKESIILKKNIKYLRNELIEKLDEFGYTKSSLVTTTGEYAVRGYIIDVFGIEQEEPIRIEFFGDSIDSIRTFDENTQLSIENINEMEIFPFKERQTEKKSSLKEYLNKPIIIKFDPNQITNSYEKLLKDVKYYNEKNKFDINTKYFHNYDSKEKCITIDTINKKSIIETQTIINFNSDIELLSQFIEKNIKEKKFVILCLPNQSQIDYIKSKITNSQIITNPENIRNNKLNIMKIKINEGFIIENYVVISDKDFEKKVIDRIKYKSSLKIGKRISSFDQINIGDYVVHRIHGIGIYNGVVTIEKNKMKMDYIQILYKDNDKVYIPIEKINILFKYTIKDGRSPVINKLNSLDWVRKKQKVKDKIDDISDELIELYAEREKLNKKPYKSIVDEAKFASEFIYDPTPDQLKAIEEIDKDLESTKPMDRLLCGDVGYGKTEVAFRTIFKAIMNGYQVAYLCPTTILSNQQYQNAIERFKNYPINIALLNRFVSVKETKKILKNLKEGLIDLVIGTHKLLNDKIEYKNLNLLIIDEEQRFGVLHKEKIKSFKKNVNVLTLSATPIPRTMKMALSGIRDLSIIDTPPINRYPVQTYVIEEDEIIIRDSIYKEISREGQCFVLYNRIDNIEEQAYKISQLVPEASVISAHGQMNKEELEQIMSEFIDGKYNVLVCTTIIESGIDIPNVNTLIVIDADQFGLSQLYQIRGRVGRSDRIAYAYLMYKKTKLLTETAIQRLKSIQEFTELGSGYKIAMRDLAIRGAGDILGSEQAGFIDSVGIELYMEMINEKMQEISGNKVLEEVETKNLIDVETHIPNTFIDDEMIKIEIHKRINEVRDRDTLKEIQREIEDRFGLLTSEIDIYLHQRLFENWAKNNNISQINQTDKTIEIIIPKEISMNVSGDKLLINLNKIDSSIKVRYHNRRIIITLIIKKLDKHFIYYLLDIIELFEKKIVIS